MLEGDTPGLNCGSEENFCLKLTLSSTSCMPSALVALRKKPLMPPPPPDESDESGRLLLCSSISALPLLICAGVGPRMKLSLPESTLCRGTSWCTALAKTLIINKVIVKRLRERVF